MTKKCPNYGGCRLVQTDIVEPESSKKDNYMRDYCVGEENWKSCRRYIIKRSLWICPDYVLPDSDITEDEVADRYEKGEK